MTNSPSTVFDGTSHVRESGAQGRWVLDGAASTLGFEVKHFWGAMTVRGRIAGLAGDVEVAGDGAVSASLSLDSNSVDTGQKRRDQHLRSPDFFDAAAHPRIEVQAEVTLASPTRANAQGVLTVAGRSQNVAFEASTDLSADRQQLTVETSLDVDRTGFGMTWSPLGTAAKMAQVNAHLVFRHVGIG